MMEHPNLDFSADIIKASLKNLAFTYRFEERAPYVFWLIELSKQKEKIRQAILTGLSNETKCPHDLEQLFELAALFAMNGDTQAEKTIYRRFGKKIIKGYDAVGDYAIIEMAGKEGWLHVAKTMGKILEKCPDAETNTFKVRFYYLDSLSKKVHALLKEAAGNNRHIQVYYDAILKRRKQPRRRKRRISNYEIFKEQVEADKRIMMLPSQMNELFTPEVKRLADDLSKERTRIRQAKYLRVFEDIKYPYDYKILLEYAKRPYSSRDRLVENAVNALRAFKGDDIRRFALKQMRESNRPEIYASLLICNYKHGDAKRLLDVIEKTKDKHRLHDLARDCRIIYSENKTKECRDPLMALYDRLTCGKCRARVVEIMIENDVLPENIWREIKYDSEESLRELAETKGVKV